ncbi:hypothetical protein Ahy_A07g034224 [Arachis hypogaea]|uniref:Uncharacterized protein n=1 Tax=Arachis hypogaea TaxID=3818 RepID=A0A445CBA8_ARAHY|nr:hypothetical protein Ahy_A07g034224 [Arachis hypogaea]
MADEVSNVNGVSATNDSAPVNGQPSDVVSLSEWVVVNESVAARNNGRNTRPCGNPPLIQPQVIVGWPPYGLPPGYTPPVSGFVPPIRNRKHPQLIPRGQNTDDVLARLCANQIPVMGLGFYMRRKLLNMHIPDLAHLAERVWQSKPFSRKEKVSYVAMKSSDEEFNLEAEVDLAELRKGPPYLKDRDVSLCPRCNTVFDAEAAAIFEKERMKKELAHREEQARQKQPIRLMEGQSSGGPQKVLLRLSTVLKPLAYSGFEIVKSFRIQTRNPQWGHRGPPRGRYPFFHGRARGYPRGRGRRGRQPSKMFPVDKVKGATPSVHFRIVFSTDGETYPKGVPSPVKLDKGKAVVIASDGDKDKVVG